MANGVTIREKQGEFFWLEPTRHAIENVGTDQLELVEIEMKNVTAESIPVAAPSHTETTPSNQPLPVEQEPHHRWEFQNQYVRVLDVLLAPANRHCSTPAPMTASPCG
jgi:hypothetical protein